MISPLQPHDFAEFPACHDPSWAKVWSCSGRCRWATSQNENEGWGAGTPRNWW